MRLFGSANMAAVMDKFGLDDDTPIDSAMVSRSLENAQKKWKTIILKCVSMSWNMMM